MAAIKALRKKIDQVDASIIKQLAKRQQLSIQIGKLKKQSKMDVIDKLREKELAIFHKQLCAQHKVSSELVQKLFKLVLRYSKKVQSV